MRSNPWRAAVVGLGLLVTGAGCAGQKNAAEPPAERARPQPSPCGGYGYQGQASEYHRGVLRYEEAPKAMSVQAYQHVEFWLQTSQRKFALGGSPQVPWQRLYAARGREVQVCCVWQAGPTPEPSEAVRNGIERPPRCVVVAVMS